MSLSTVFVELDIGKTIKSRVDGKTEDGMKRKTLQQCGPISSSNGPPFLLSKRNCALLLCNTRFQSSRVVLLCAWMGRFVRSLFSPHPQPNKQSELSLCAVWARPAARLHDASINDASYLLAGVLLSFSSFFSALCLIVSFTDERTHP